MIRFSARAATILLLLAALVTNRGVAQQTDLTLGIAAWTAHNLPLARTHLEAAARHDTTSYEANWRLAVTLVDIGKQTPDNQKSPARDTLYATAVTYARRAVAANAGGADGHFALAVSLGRLALTQSAHERVRLATVIRNEALEAIKIDPHHDGALHVLGRWNAEIMRLPGLQKFFAKAFLGASIFNSASWAEAERYMLLAVQYGPARVTHRLDLAKVMMDRSEWAGAKAQIDTMLTLPDADPMDPTYKRDGSALLPKLNGKLRP